MVALPAVLVSKNSVKPPSIGDGRVAGRGRVKELSEPAIVGDDGVAGRAGVMKIGGATIVDDRDGSSRAGVHEIRGSTAVIGDRRDPGGVRIDDVEGIAVDHVADD